MKVMWKEYLKERKNIVELFVTVSVLLLILFLFSRFLLFIETRKGAVLQDPLLSMFQPIDLTWMIFFIIYVALLCGIVNLMVQPKNFVFTLQLYCLIVLIRITVMYLLPLEPPQNMIALKDPFVELFGNGKTLTKDLFFSGHTATLLMLFLVTEKKYLKTFFLICTIVVAASVLLQHVHYTIDVLAAIFFTYMAYVLLINFKR